MDDQGIGLAREALKQIQLFWCLDDTDIEVRRLGGLTNRSEEHTSELQSQ